MFTDLSLQVPLGSVPSSQTSHCRLPLWFRQSWQMQSLPISLYRSPIVGAKFTSLSLQITPYKEDEKKLYQPIYILLRSTRGHSLCRQPHDQRKI